MVLHFWKKKTNYGQFNWFDNTFTTIFMARLFGVRAHVIPVHFNWHLLWLCAKDQHGIGIFNGRSQYDDISDSLVIGCQVRWTDVPNWKQCSRELNTKKKYSICNQSFISGITLLGLPTEIYSFGVQYLYVIGGVVMMGFVMGFVYLPVFHNLKITSTYEVSWTK